jgi:DNA-3-methyladenine glycosylase
LAEVLPFSGRISLELNFALNAEPSLASLKLAKLPAAFYSLPTLDLARQLLGKVLVTVGGESTVTAGLIVETEGYIAENDPACHAFSGITKRNAVMWGEPGHAYIYFTYGNHWMINVVSEPDGVAAAVLIRALEPIAGLPLMRLRRNLELLKGTPQDRQLANGPGKLCKALGVDSALNGANLQSEHLFMADAPDGWCLPPFDIVETTRIGITKGVEFPWRYYVKGNRFVSKW